MDWSSNISELLVRLELEQLTVEDLNLAQINQILESNLTVLQNDPKLLDEISSSILTIANQYNNSKLAIAICESILKISPDDLYIISNLSEFYWLNYDYDNAFKFIKLLEQKAQTKLAKLYANYRLLDLMLKLGDWSNMEKMNELYIKDLSNLLNQELDLNEPLVQEMFVSLVTKLPYIQDYPQINRNLQNKISLYFEKHINRLLGFTRYPITQQRKQKKYPTIGYLSSTLGRNSVGWLSRWLFKYHNRENYFIYLYVIEQNEDDITEFWFKQNVDKYYNLPSEPLLIAQQIQQDQVDILIDLDSLTRPVSCAVMALKSAPIQATWLGLDATGIPNIDYFIVDPYVVEQNAQQYYQEQLWFLPQTYIAVDGFEIASANISRAQLNIPQDALVYFTSQTGMKRHPDIIRIQLQILKQVPNSFLLIKGLADVAIIKELFVKLAQQEDIAAERLHFLGASPSEEMHRANLSLADIILDTYPYNGATTTLEALWLGIPLVTLVGKQFAARNSYSFMLNAGISEGIAYTHQEYIEWGVRFGQNEQLRATVHWKLFKNRQNSPLWNAQLFSKHMESAYLAMWQQYCR